MECAQVVCCTDTDGVKDALIACQSSSANSTPILHAILQLEFDLKWNAWFSRVPTESNILDPPSRGEFQTLLSEGVPRHDIDLEDMWSELLALSKRGGEYQQLEPHAEKELQCEGSCKNLRKQFGKSDLNDGSCSEWSMKA